MPRNTSLAPAATNTRDSELEMQRVNAVLYGGRLRRLWNTLLSYRDEVPMGTPRRSIDREQQQYSPSYD